MVDFLLIGVAAAVTLLNVALLIKMLLVLEKLQVAADINVVTQADIQAAAAVVAEDLAARYVRADAVAIDGEPGEAADVAARSDPDSLPGA